MNAFTAIAMDRNGMALVGDPEVPVASDVDPSSPTTISTSGNSQATTLIGLANDVGLFHCPKGDVYATVPVDDHQETHRLRGRAFKTWLRLRYFQTQGRAPGSQAMQDAVETLAGRALFEGDELPVHVRLADANGCVYLDMGDKEWRVIELRPGAWRIIPASDAPVRFRRTQGLEALPEPRRGGSLADLRQFVNVADEDWALILGYAVSLLRPRGPHVILALISEHGTAKSTTTRIIRRLVDPNFSDLRDAPRDMRDLMIAANNGYVLAFDNLSYLRPQLSDALARLSTGAGLSTRTLYEDDEETLFCACRPVVLNGIEDVVSRPDLLDRALLVFPPIVPDEARQLEEDFWPRFEEARPGLLGALLDAACSAMARAPEVRLTSFPRMADFARYCVAAEPALGLSDGEFLSAYMKNRRGAHSLALESSPVAERLVEVVRDRGRWEGTSGELVALLLPDEDSERRHLGKDWPKSGPQMAAALKRYAPNLRAMGIGVEYEEHKRPRRWVLTSIWVDGTDRSDSSDASDPFRAPDGESVESVESVASPALWTATEAAL